MKRKYMFVIAIPVVLIIIASCKRDPYRIRLSASGVNIEILRLEKDLFSLDPDEIAAKVPVLEQKYGTFFRLFGYVINAGEVNDPEFGNNLTAFCTDKQNNDVYRLTMDKYPDLNKVENDLESAFRHYIHYFPAKKVPAVYSCITGFNNSIITGDSVLGIGLDRYLGADCEYYPRLEIYRYMAAKMTPDYIVPDCMYGWAASEYDFKSMGYSADNVLTEIIHEGKLKYFEKCMLPDVSDEIIFGFTPSQMKFCRNNEDLMWQYLIENDLIFKTDQFTIRKLVGEAPFTSYFTNESPGKAAVWTGFRIVESYMNENRQETLESLMKNTNIQEILEKAKYNPK
ncbi:MAG: hypothetical protein GX431_05105 [Bacteroidales bacterium]|jgi:hypothetical protein|nr:hypothetical protein [Bacteroidales bacterium]